MGLYEDHSQTTPHKKTFFRRRFPGHFSGPLIKSGHVVLNSTEETKPVLFFFLCLAFLVLLSLERMTRLSSYEVLVRVYTITRFNHQFFRMSVRLKDSVFWKYFMPVIISCGGSPTCIVLPMSHYRHLAYSSLSYRSVNGARVGSPGMKKV